MIPSSGLREGHVLELYESVFRPHFESVPALAISNAEGLRLRYRVFPALEAAERGAIVVLPGRSESTLKYAETIYDLCSLGFRVYAFDHRGQGFSDRARQRDSHVGHVGDFQSYADDLSLFHDSVVVPDGAPRANYLAHSMGACVLSLFLSQRTDVQPAGVILSAPMWRISFGDTPERLAYAITLALCAVGRGEHYAPSSGPLDIEQYGTDLTNCPERLEMLRRVLRDTPAVRLGGPSAAWLLAAIRATRHLRKGDTLRRTFSRPTLLLEAGADTVLDVEANHLVDGAPGVTRVAFAEAMHDIFYATESVRARVMQAVALFLDSVSPRRDA